MGPLVPPLREYCVSMYLVLTYECRAMRDRWMNMLYRFISYKFQLSLFYLTAQQERYDTIDN